jgi:hypothetical protein
MINDAISREANVYYESFIWKRQQLKPQFVDIYSTLITYSSLFNY